MTAGSGHSPVLWGLALLLLGCTDSRTPDTSDGGVDAGREDAGGVLDGGLLPEDAGSLSVLPILFTGSVREDRPCEPPRDGGVLEPAMAVGFTLGASCGTLVGVPEAWNRRLGCPCR